MHYTHWLRWGIIAGIFMVPFVPFIVADGVAGGHGFFVPLSNLFFPFITGKNIAFRLIVEVIVGLYVLLALREPKYRPHPSWLLWAVGAFVLWMGVATALSVDPIKSFWSNFERMDGYLTVLHVAAYFLVISSVLTVERLWTRFFHVTVAASVLMGLDALFQLLNWIDISSQSGARVDTTFGNAIYVAVYMLFHIFLALFLLVKERRAWVQVYLGIALALQFTALFYTQTRGALLGFVGGLLIAALYVAWRGQQKEWQGLRRISWGFLAIAALLGGTFFALRDSEFIKQNPTLNRVASISLTDTTTQSRFTLWREMVVPGAIEKPLFGWGQENFNFVFNKYYAPSMYAQESWFDRTHNEILDWLIAGGIPALVLYLSFFALAVYAIVRSSLSVPEQAVLLGLLGGYAFNNITVFHDLPSFVYFFVILAFAHSLSMRHAPSLALSKPVEDHLIAIAAPIVGLVIIMGAWAVNGTTTARATALVEAVQMQKPVRNEAGAVVPVRKAPTQTLAEFQAALAGVWPPAPIGRQEATEQFLQYATGIFSQASVSPQDKQAVYEAGFAAGTTLLQERAGDARLELFFSNFLAQAGQTQEALEHVDKALIYSPNKQQILMQQGAIKLQRGDIEGALEALKKAFELAPAYDLARILYAAGFIGAGRGAQADALLTERFGSPVFDNEQLLQVYVNQKLYDRAAAIWQLRIDKDPKNVQLYLGLASMYFTAGKKAETIAVLRKIAEIEPRAAAEMQDFITQIENGTLKPQ